ncbi:MAG: AmmeMemoRadiSam system protein A [Spirochaetaceae bacterium]
MIMELSDKEKRLLLQTARESISSKLEARAGNFPPPTDTLETVCGAFVTLHEEGQLRGCIGHITGVKPLYEGIKELAVSSAFRDPRFRPLEKEELNKVEIEISVLTPPEKGSPEDVELGTHGILLQSGQRSGVLLPQVPLEQGWNRLEFLDNTCRKAGLPAGCWKEENTELFLFSAIVFGENEFAREGLS